nr:hypothetical protein [Calditrichia bacterium]
VLAERASRVAAKFPRHQISWKPDLLLPVDNPRVWSGPLLFIRDVTHPSGSIFAFTVSEGDRAAAEKDMKQLLMPLSNQKIYVNSTVIEDNDFIHGAKMVIQTLKGGTFKPNVLFLTLGDDATKEPALEQMVLEAARDELGIVILRQHPRVAFGMQKHINLWLRERSPNWHLAVLLALHLQLNWNGKLNLVTTATSPDERGRLQEFMEKLSDLARLPSMTEYHIIDGNFRDALKNAPRADINIFGIGDRPDFKLMRDAADLTNTSCLYVKDSGHESALV